jgi:hypothetical protein
VRGLDSIAIVCWLGAFLAAGASVAGDTSRADQLRAGYLLNFVKFVEWPGALPADGRTLCFFGGDGVRYAIAAAQSDKPSGMHAVALRVLTKGDSVAGCHLLYVEATSFSGDRALNVTGLPVLTVSDAPDFIHHGGVVELFAEGNRLRFNINLDNARRAGLRISSSLLQLASHVEETAR